MESLDPNQHDWVRYTAFGQLTGVLWTGCVPCARCKMQNGDASSMQHAPRAKSRSPFIRCDVEPRGAAGTDTTRSRVSDVGRVYGSAPPVACYKEEWRAMPLVERDSESNLLTKPLQLFRSRDVDR